MTKNRKPIWRILGVAFTCAFCVVLFTIRSYFYSDSITVCDITFSSDEGLFLLTIPMVRRVHDEPLRNEWFMYFRENDLWTTSIGGGKVPLRNVIKMIKSFGSANCREYAGFGCWITDWYSPSRPGRAINLFVPMWALTLVAISLYLLFEFRYIRYSIRSFLVCVTIFAVLVWITTLKSPAAGQQELHQIGSGTRLGKTIFVDAFRVADSVRGLKIDYMPR